MFLSPGESFYPCSNCILRDEIIPSIENRRMVVSREQDANVKGRLGLKQMAYTSLL
jgi:hypothetical protein